MSAADAPAAELIPAAPSHAQNPLLQRAGKGWLITFESEKALIPGSDGMSRLVRLLKAPGQQLSALDVVAGSSPNSKAGKRRGVRDAPLDEGMNAIGDLGEIVDDVAREQYRQRAQDLKAELADAFASKNEERRLSARAELEYIEHELNATAGKGGKTRRFSEAQERARQTVWHTIKAALTVIEEEMPTLGLHLRNSLRFGHYPSYDPQPRLTWDITT
jgi:hypothetical protein